MGINDLKNKHVAVLGYGQEGQAITRYLTKHGVKPVLFDHRPWEAWEKEQREEIKNLGLNFIFGPDAFLELRTFDVAFRSPGIPIQKIKDLGLKLEITSQTKFFFENCKAEIIGVTGTKGKGTTASLIYHILATNRFPLTTKVYLTGNIGKTQPLDILDNLQPEDWVVYELSSYQLQDLTQSPHIAVVLMVTGEHLDYHKDLAEYHSAKSSITRNQTPADWAVINSAYPASVEIGYLGLGKKVYFSGQEFNLLPEEKIQLKGRHNLENIQAAAKVAEILDIDPAITKQAIAEFRGLEHRLEFVAEKGGIKFYDDSFSTTPESAVAAIKAFSEPLVVILGGSKKNSDFTELAKTIAQTPNIRALILIGDEAPRIKQAIGEFLKAPKPLMLEGAKNMPEIFDHIKQVAKAGDAVLLSPACASFGMFKNYKDRGEQFKNLVLNWN